MRQILVLGFVAIVGCIASNVLPQSHVKNKVDPYILEDVINSTMEMIRNEMPETMAFDKFSITIPEEITMLRGSAELDNFELTGIKNFQVPYLNLELFSLEFNFTFVIPSINLNTGYVGDLVLFDLIPLYGQGPANFHIEGAEIKGSAEADLSNGIALKNLRIQLYVISSTFDVHGALNNEDFSAIISQLLNDVVTSFIDNHQDIISNIFSPIIETILNTALAGSNTNQ